MEIKTKVAKAQQDIDIYSGLGVKSIWRGSFILFSRILHPILGLIVLVKQCFPTCYKTPSDGFIICLCERFGGLRLICWKIYYPCKLWTDRYGQIPSSILMRMTIRELGGRQWWSAYMCVCDWN